MVRPSVVCPQNGLPNVGEYTEDDAISVPVTLEFEYRAEIMNVGQDAGTEVDRQAAEGEYLQALDPRVNPSPENQRLAFDSFFNTILEDMIEANADLYRKITEDATFGDIFRRAIFERIASGIGRNGQSPQL